MIQLMSKNNQLHLVDAGKTLIPYQPGADQHAASVVSAVKELLSKGNFKGRSVVSSLPNEVMKITSVRTSESDLVKASAQLQLEAAYRFGLDPNQDPIRFLPAGAVLHGDQVKQEMILFGAQRKAIDRHIECLESMSLEPVGLDPSPCALFRSLLQSMPSPSESLSSTRVCIEIGYSDSTVVIGRHEQICFVKQLPYGLFQLDNSIAEELGISNKEASILRKELLHIQTSANSNTQYEPTSREVITQCIRSLGEKLAKEILLCLRYHSVTFRGEFVDSIHICGGGAYERTMVDTLRQHLSPNPEEMRPFASIEPMSQHGRAIINQIGYEWAIPVGLAAKLLQATDHGPSVESDMTENILSKTIV
jgi:type IV pilus assembly protein PilM